MKKIFKQVFTLQNFVVVICLAWILSIVISGLNRDKEKQTLNPNLPQKQAEIQVKNSDGSTKTVKLTVEIAETAQELTLGLSNRGSLATNSGMYFILPVRNTSSFWMKEMRFPIDIIWIDGNKIVGIAKNCPIPKDKNNIPTFQSPTYVTNVLEVNSGFTDQNNITAGNQINLLD